MASSPYGSAAARNGSPAGEAAPPHAGNNFDALRLFLALMVVLYHLALLSAAGIPAGLFEALRLGAELGVQGFFVLSGGLVLGSLQRSASLALYAEKRVRRLYPAYAAVILASAAAALLVSAAARADPAGVLSYVGWNLLFLNFLQPELPGLFAGNPVTAVNGALWTIKIEVMFYLILPLLAWLLQRAGRLKLALAALIYGLAEVWRLGLSSAAAAEFSPLAAKLALQLPGYMSFFLTGMLLVAAPVRLIRLAAAPALGLLALSLLVPALEPIRAISLGTVLIFLARGIPWQFEAARFGDFSYGLYIAHFPVIQAFVAAGAFAAAPAGAAIAVLGTVSIAAFLLWRIVERPALRSDSAYRAAASGLPSAASRPKAAP